VSLEVVERPAAGATERILVLLPGFCDEPSTWTDRLDLLDPEQRWHIAVPRPRVQTRGGPGWYRVTGDGPNQAELTDSVAAIEELITALLVQHSLTADDVVVVGFSQGGATTLATFLDPNVAVRPAALGVLSGYLPVRDDELEVSRASGLPILFAHGTDDDMIDVVRGRSAAKALARAGAVVTWTEVGGGHRLGPDLLDPLRGWLDAVADGQIPSDPPA
jgi:predicted esterase